MTLTKGILSLTRDEWNALLTFDPQYRYWCPKHNCWKTPAMRWFVKKGDAVKEGEPVKIKFTNRQYVVGEKPQKNTWNIWCDEESNDPPVHKNSRGRDLVVLTADLSHFSSSDLASLPIHRGNDGVSRYEIEGIVEATFSSASTKYTLLYRGHRYDTVTAEYV